MSVASAPRPHPRPLARRLLLLAVLLLLALPLGWPPYTGFSIGFHIVQDYLARHPSVSFATLAGVAAATVFAGSGYTG